MPTITLSRRHGERVFIGNDIIIEVLQRKPGGPEMRLRITAPSDIKVLREELVERDKRTKTPLEPQPQAPPDTSPHRACRRVDPAAKTQVDPLASPA